MTTSFICDTIDDVEEPEQQNEREQSLLGPELIEQIENYADRMWQLAQNDKRNNDSLKLNFYDLQDIIDRHAYNKVACGCYLGKLEAQLQGVRNELEKVGNALYRSFTDKVLGRNVAPTTDANGKPIKISTTGVQKMDAKYRSSEYTRDQTYCKLQAEELRLIEEVAVAKALYESYQDKSKMILGMQKTMNNEGRNS